MSRGPRRCATATAERSAEKHPAAKSAADLSAALLMSHSSCACGGGDDALFALVDIPEHRRRRAIQYAAQRFAPGARDGVLAKRDVDHLVVVLLLDLGGDLL